MLSGESPQNILIRLPFAQQSKYWAFQGFPEREVSWTEKQRPIHIPAPLIAILVTDKSNLFLFPICKRRTLDYILNSLSCSKIIIYSLLESHH